MRDEKAIANFERVYIGASSANYFFGDTTIVADEYIDGYGNIRLRPVYGDQVACGQWEELSEGEVAAYCELLEDELRRRGSNEKPE